MKHVKKLALFSILVGSLAFGNFSYAETISAKVEENIFIGLTECIDIALKNNPAISASRFNTEIYKHRIGKVRAQNYLPSFSLKSGYDKSNPMTNSVTSFMDRDVSNYTLANVSVSQQIWDFGRTTTEVNEKKELYAMSKEDLQEVINSTKYNVKEAYYYLLYTQQQRDVIKETLKQFEKHLEQAKAFYEVGTKPKIDVTIANVNYNNAKVNLIKAENEVSYATAKLNNTMGLTQSEDYTLKDKLQFGEYEFKFEDMVDTAYKSRPSLKSAEKRANASKKVIKLTKYEYAPTLDASLNAGRGGGNFHDDTGWGMGVSLNIPTLNPFLTRKSVNEANAVFLKDTADALKIKQDILLEIKNAYINFVETKERVPAAKLAMEQAKENHELAQGRYKVGVGDPIELKDAEISYKNAQLDYLKALYDYNISVAYTQKAMGKEINPSIELEEIELEQ